MDLIAKRIRRITLILYIYRVSCAKRRILQSLSEFLPRLDIRHTLIVLKAERRFVAFGNFIAA